MKIRISILFFLIVSFLIFQIASAEENEYGIVRAWFNGQNATANGVELKLGETAEIKVDVISKINGNVYVKLKEPGVTKAYNIISGPSKHDEYINNYEVTANWSRTYSWFIEPNGNWKNGNAPVNVFVSFSKNGNQKPIQFTIANPYILDEQYTGATTTPAPGITGTGTAAKPARLPSMLFILATLLIVSRWRRG